MSTTYQKASVTHVTETTIHKCLKAVLQAVWGGGGMAKKVEDHCFKEQKVLGVSHSYRALFKVMHYHMKKSSSVCVCV